eukprot:7825752-Ditylum_brightwellii.AAC.1
MLDGSTVDISVFCYHFLQLIKYLDPKIKFPDVKWQNGHFVCITWEHDDPFTCLVWADPDEGGWQKGLELVYNVVRPRQGTLLLSKTPTYFPRQVQQNLPRNAPSLAVFKATQLPPNNDARTLTPLEAAAGDLDEQMRRIFNQTINNKPLDAYKTDKTQSQIEGQWIATEIPPSNGGDSVSRHPRCKDGPSTEPRKRSCIIMGKENTKRLGTSNAKVRRVVCAKKKKVKRPIITVYKYGAEVPRNLQHALQLDKENNNNMWQDTIALEIKALNKMDCFSHRDEHTGKKYQ